MLACLKEAIKHSATGDQSVDVVFASVPNSGWGLHLPEAPLRHRRSGHERWTNTVPAGKPRRSEDKDLDHLAKQNFEEKRSPTRSLGTPSLTHGKVGQLTGSTNTRQYAWAKAHATQLICKLAIVLGTTAGPPHLNLAGNPLVSEGRFRIDGQFQRPINDSPEETARFRCGGPGRVGSLVSCGGSCGCFCFGGCSDR